MTAWDDARVKHISIAKKLEQEIPGYGYSDEGQAKATDEKLRAHLVENLREAKSKLFDIIQFLFEIHAEKMVGKDLEKLRNEIDTFSDEIKVHHFEWDELTEEFFELLLKHDSDLLKGTEAVGVQVEEISRLSVGYKPLDHQKEFDIERLEQASQELFKLLKALFISFKERAALLEIEEQDLERVYQEIKQEIARRF